MGLPRGKLHVLHELHEPGEFKPDAAPFDDAARLEVDTIQGGVGFLVDLDGVAFQGLAHRHAIPYGVNVDTSRTRWFWMANMLHHST